jgi:peptidyl-prolyl cis-trans isomerase C
MRTKGTISFIVLILLVLSFAAVPLFAGGKQEKADTQEEQQSSQEGTEEGASPQSSETQDAETQESEGEGTPIPSGSVSTSGDVAAVVNGEEIPMSRLEQQVRNYQQQMMQQGQQPQGMQLSQLRRQALESIINTEVLYQVARNEGFEATEEQIESEIDSMKQRFGGEQQFQGVLQQQGMSEASLRENISRYYTIQKFIEERFGSEVSISDEEAQNFYNENTDSFKQQEQVRASHILIEVKEDASEEQQEQARATLQEVQQKLEEGAEFSELAREYSEGPSAKNGGDLGYFGRGQMVKSFEEKAFAMQPGEVSDVVETRFGYHLIKVTDKKEEKVVPYEEVKEKIVNYLREQSIGEKITDFLEEKKPEMEIERTALQSEQGSEQQ